MLSQAIIELATEFQQSHEGLDENTNDYCYCHDFLHAVTGLGISEGDESLVLMIESCLGGQDIPVAYSTRIAGLISLIPQETLLELINALTQHFAE